MDAEAERGAHHDLVKNGGSSVDHQLAAACGSHNPMQVPGIHVGDGDATAPPQKVVCALQIAVTAPDRMSLPL